MLVTQVYWKERINCNVIYRCRQRLPERQAILQAERPERYRGGHGSQGRQQQLIPNTGVVVGDVLVLTTGDKVTAGTIASPLVVRVMHECVMLSQAAAAACTTACEALVRDHALHHCAVLTKCSC